MHQRIAALWLIAVLLLAATAPVAQAQSPGKGRSKAALGLTEGPLIRLDERRWDVGRVPQNSAFRHSFRLRNDGTAPLVIQKVETDCGCTAAMYRDTVIAPGASSALDLQFDSRDYEGEVQRVVVLKTNDPAEPRIDLVVRAEVVPAVLVDQRVLDFGEVRRGQEPVVMARFLTDARSPFRIEAPKEGRSHVAWEVSPSPADTGKAMILKARLRRDAPMGIFNERVIVPVQHPKSGNESIMIRGQVYSYFRLKEKTLQFGRVRSGEKVARTTFITADGTLPYRITSGETAGQGFSVAIRPAGTGFSVEVTYVGPKFTGPPPNAGKVREEIVLHTTDPNEPILRLEAVARLTSR